MQAIKDLGEFAMYHDYKNKAAITIFNDPDEGNIAVRTKSSYMNHISK